MTDERNDQYWGDAEDSLREAGYSIPVAWMASFIEQLEREMSPGMLEDNLAEQLPNLIHEMRTGEIL